MSKTAQEFDDSFLEIDQHQLDKEWVEQPRLYLKYSRKLADAELAVDEAKSNLDVVKAELDDEIRTDPDSFALEKVTDAVVASCVVRQDAYKEAQRAYHKAKHKASVLLAVKWALEQRKKALEKLVDLHGQQYFSTPRAKGDSGRIMDEVHTSSVFKRGQRKRNRDE